MVGQRRLINFKIKQIPLKHMCNIYFKVKMVGQRGLIIFKIKRIPLKLIRNYILM